MQTTRPYVRMDEHGAMRVGQTRVTLDSIVAAFRQGHSAETIQQEYPSVSLEEVYGAITYYLANQEQVDAYLESQSAVWKESREKAAKAESPVVRRLRNLAARTKAAAQ
ncbi:MAG: DUF433 domain-containing protein [Pirellulales bacterium]|nr:DUF433 domain-containing protein [Pirellulales bacterium]